MLSIYRELRRAMSAGEKSVLVRIIRKLGSAPRTAGSALLLKADGSLVGSVGGGLLEHDVLRKAREVFETGRSALLHIRLSGQEVAASEMLCGGDVDVLLEPLFPGDAGEEAVIQELVAMMEQGRRGAWVTVVSGGRGSGGRFLVTEAGAVIGDASRLAGVGGAELKRWAALRGPALETPAESESGATVFVEPLESEAVLLLFGAGHISTFVAPLARTVGFRVWVIDDRAQFANPERFPDADRIMVSSVAEAFGRIAVSRETFIAIVTRGHLHDRDALRSALATRPAYIGMIGSRRKRDLIYASLIQEGVSAAEFQRVRCPIGISIDAQTPQEIAVSIVAELIQVRARAGGRCGAGISAFPETRTDQRMGADS
jgi:xanthine dehydrogenase accessory factor